MFEMPGRVERGLHHDRGQMVVEEDLRPQLAAVDVDVAPAGPLVADVSPAPALALFERLTAVDAAGAVIEAIERAAAGR